MKALILALAAVSLVSANLRAAQADPARWRTHIVYQLNGLDPAIHLVSDYQVASRFWGRDALVPYLAYMPEKDRVAMVVLYDADGKGRMPSISFSDDRGATWSVPKSTGFGGLSLTYVGKGVLFTEQAISRDYGESWDALPESDNGETWLPALVDTDLATGEVTRILRGFWRPLRKWAPGLRGPYCQARVKSSYDLCRTWTDEVIPGDWLSVNEVSLVRAKNGDIVAACRMDINKRLETTAMDDYTGMGVSISKDNGRSWSNPFDPRNMLFDFGRHHAWLVCMPDGKLVMTYIARRGFSDSEDGYPRFGIEALVSEDNGKTWDFDHRYILHVYKGDVPAIEFMAFQGSASNASTAVLPDGSLLTAFNMNYKQIGLVRWRLNEKGTNKSTVVSKASFDSDLRNKFDMSLLGQKPKAGPVNIAVPQERATLTSSQSDINSDLLMEDPYLYSQFPPGVVMESSPAWVEIKWPEQRSISKIVILTGDPNYRSGAPVSWVPLDYRLQYRKGRKWVDLVPPEVIAKGEAAYTWHDDSKEKKPVNLQQFIHQFPAVRTDAVRLTVTRSADKEKQRTFLKTIRLY